MPTRDPCLIDARARSDRPLLGDPLLDRYVEFVASRTRPNTVKATVSDLRVFFADCLRIGGQWVHLRMCMSCGHVGCCDNSPNRHATAHFNADQHPLIRSYEPEEDWWYCYLDDLAFLVDGAPSFEHP